MWRRRLGWFAGLWVVSVAALAGISLIIKFAIGQ